MIDSKKRSNSVIKFTLVNNGTLQWDVLGAGSVRLSMEKVSEANRLRAAIHGLKQRVSDGAALSNDTETGKPATALEKQAAMQRIVDHLESGSAEWNLKASGVRESGGLFMRVLFELKKEVDREKLVAWAKGKSAQDRAALLELPEWKVIHERLQKEMTEGVDVSALLDGLNDL